MPRKVGWVERSVTQHLRIFVGFRFTSPNLQENGEGIVKKMIFNFYPLSTNNAEDLKCF